MDNQYILKLIEKDLEELNQLVDALKKEENLSELLIDIVANKASTLQKEIKMLNASELVSEKVDQRTETAVVEEKQEEQEEEIEETIVEEAPQLIEEEELVELVAEDEDLDVTNEEEEPAKEQEEIFEAKPEELPEEITEQKVEEEPEAETIEREFPVEPEAVATSEPKSKDTINKKVIGERFLKEVSLNDRIAKNSIQAKVKPKAISNLKRAIGINDRFLFQRELFANNPSTMQQAIEAVEQSGSIKQAVEYLDSNFSWNENEASLKFLELVKRRFQN